MHVQMKQTPSAYLNSDIFIVNIAFLYSKERSEFNIQFLLCAKVETAGIHVVCVCVCVWSVVWK